MSSQVSSHLSFRDALDEICIRFFNSDLSSNANRIFFQIQQAHWFYIDNILPNNNHLPNLNWNDFAFTISNICFPAIAKNFIFYIKDFDKYLSTIPVCGCVLVDNQNNVLLVKGTTWSFPKGKMDEGETEEQCAERECYEETGYRVRVDPNFVIRMQKPKPASFYIIRNFDRNSKQDRVVEWSEIRKLKWVPLKHLNKYRLFGGTTIYNALAFTNRNKDSLTFGSNERGWDAEEMFKTQERLVNKPEYEYPIHILFQMGLSA